MKGLILTCLVALACLFAAPITASAFNPFGADDVCSGRNARSATCKDAAQQEAKGTDPLSGKDGLLADITDIVAYIAGAAAIILLLIGSIRFITSGSDMSNSAQHDADVENARRTIAAALIGLLIIVLARTMILFVLSKI